MITNSDLEALIERARARGAILRTKYDASRCIVAVSIGLLPGGDHYRTTAEAGWVPPIQAAEIIRAAPTMPAASNQTPHRR